MVSSTDRSGSAKRPWPFDSYETLERTPAFTPSFNSVAGFPNRQHDETDGIGWMQEIDVPSFLGGDSAVSNQILEGWNHGITIFDPNIWNDHTAIETTQPTWNAFQQPNIAGYAFTGQYAETLGQSDWNAQATAQGLSPSEQSSLAPYRAAAQPQLWTGSGEGRFARDNDTLIAQNFDTCDPHFAPWTTVEAEQAPRCLELAENIWPTPNTQVGDAGWVATPQTATETPVQVLGQSDSTSHDSNGSIVCFGTVSHTLTSFLLFDVRVTTIFTDL